MARQKHIKNLYSSPIFTIEQKEITFDNGEVRQYEIASNAQSVMVVALNKKNQILCIKEYCAGVDDYCIGLPKGRIETNQTPEEACQKELQEEIHKKAETLIKLGVLTLSPGYSNHKTHLFLALNLVDNALQGDEPEELIIETYSFAELEKLIDDNIIQESRVIAAIHKARRLIEQSSQENSTHRDTVFI